MISIVLKQEKDICFFLYAHYEHHIIDLTNY